MPYNPTVLPQKQVSEYYPNFQFKMFKSPKHLMTFCRRIRIVLTVHRVFFFEVKPYETLTID